MLVVGGGGESQGQYRNQSELVVVGGEAIGQLCCEMLPIAGGVAIHLLKRRGTDQGIHVSRCGSAHVVAEGEGWSAVGGGGLPGEGDCQALFLEVSSHGRGLVLRIGPPISTPAHLGLPSPDLIEAKLVASFI